MSRHATTGDPASFYAGSDNLSRVARLSREPLVLPPPTTGISVVPSDTLTHEAGAPLLAAVAAATELEIGDIQRLAPHGDETTRGRNASVAGVAGRDKLLFWDPRVGARAAAEILPRMTSALAEGVDLVVAGVGVRLTAEDGHLIRCEVAAGPGSHTLASGSALLLHTAWFARVGGFDEQLPVECQDLDLALRFVRAGLTVAVVPLPPGSARPAVPDTIDDPVFRRRWWSYLAARALVGAG